MAGVWRDKGGRVALGTVLGIAVLLGVAYVAVAAWGSDRMPRHSSVEGVELGSMSIAEAERALGEVGGEESLSVTYGDGREVSVDPDEAGLALDVPATVERAAGGGSFSPGRVWALITGGGESDPVVSVDQEAMDETLDDLEEGLGSPVQEGTVDFTGGEATAVYGEPGRGIVRDRAQDILERLMVRGGSAQLPIEPMQPTITDAAVDQALADFGQPAMSGPVTVVMAGKQLRLGPAVLARGLSMTPDGDGLVPEIDGEAIVEAVEPRLERIGTAPVDARFAVREGKVRVVPSEPGRTLDAAELEAGLPTALVGAQPAQRRVEVQGAESEADFSTADAEALGIKRRVSTFTTNFPYAEYRNTNIGRAAELVDGTVLAPGDTFSLNGIVGERTAENGFTEGYVISDGIFRTELGGGVSQMATTLFNAAFFAGLEDVEHKPHSVYIDRYPEGREATVAWPSLDLRFRNDTDHGVLVKASVTPSTTSSQGAATVSMYSTKEWRIEARKGERYNYTSPSTRYLTDSDCESATGTSGFSVDVFRDFYRPGNPEKVRTEEFNTVYIPGDAVVCGPPPGSEPEPRPGRGNGGTSGGGGGDNAGGGNGGGGNGGGGRGNG